jgi:lipoprotein signal peptidase
MSEIIDVVKECWKENPLMCIADFAIVVGIFTLILIVLHF